MLSFTVTCLLIPHRGSTPSRRLQSLHRLRFHWSACPQRAPWSTSHYLRSRRPVPSSLGDSRLWVSRASGSALAPFSIIGFIVGQRSLAQDIVSLIVDTPPNRWVRFGLRRGIHTPVVVGLGRLSSRVPVHMGWAFRTHASTAGFGFCLLNLSPFPRLIFGSVYPTSSVTLYIKPTLSSRTSPSTLRIACSFPPPTRAYTHPTRLLDFSDIPGARVALYNQDL